MARFPGQPGSASIKKAEPLWILMRQDTTGWQWHQLDHMQIIRTSFQVDNHISTS